MAIAGSGAIVSLTVLSQTAAGFTIRDQNLGGRECLDCCRCRAGYRLVLESDLCVDPQSAFRDHDFKVCGGFSHAVDILYEVSTAGGLYFRHDLDHQDATC
jgi:hypothetical protein